MTRTVEMPERICRRVERRIGKIGYTLPKLTVKLYTIWLDGGISLDEEKKSPSLSSEYTDIFGIVKDTIDPDAPPPPTAWRQSVATSPGGERISQDEVRSRYVNSPACPDRPARIAGNLGSREAGGALARRGCS